MNKLSKNKRFIWAEIVVTAVLFAMLTWLYNRQAWMYDMRYHSDLQVHIYTGINGKGYSLLYFTIGLLGKFFNPKPAAAVLEGCIVMGTMLISLRFLKKQYKLPNWEALFISVVILFLCSIYIPKIYPHFYVGGYATQPYHNITYYGMRLFAVWYMIVFCSVFPRYLEKFTFWDWICLSVPLALGTSVKPNFLIVVCFLLLPYLIYDAFAKKWKFAAVKNIFFMGTTVFPSLFILVFQAVILYGRPDSTGGTSGIALVLLSSDFFSDGLFIVMLKLARSIALPVIIYLYNRLKKKQITRCERYIMLMFWMNLLQLIVLTETGQRQNDGNFYWGIYNSAYLLFMFFLPVLAENMREIWKSWKETRIFSALDWGYFAITAMLLIGHIYSAVRYAVIIFRGDYFLI